MEIVGRYREQRFSESVMERGKQILTARLDEPSRQNSFCLSRFSAAVIDPGTVKKAILLPRE